MIQKYLKQLIIEYPVLNLSSKEQGKKLYNVNSVKYIQHCKKVVVVIMLSSFLTIGGVTLLTASKPDFLMMAWALGCIGLNSV